jgi:alpha-L-fucosidase
MSRVLIPALVALLAQVTAPHAAAQTGDAAPPDAAAPHPRQAELDARIAWWDEARFGMFIHWGLYAIPAGEWNGRAVPGVGEWIMLHGQVRPADYEPLKDRFDPVAFDADRWVRLMKEAGCRYFVITTKHHDGFALFRSDVSDYDIASTPFGRDNDRDIMRELADAARRHGVRIGWYHSIMDWNHPDYLPRRPWDDRPTQDAFFGRFKQYLHAQVREILTNYGPIDILWFDGEWEDTWTHADGVELYDLARSISPHTIVNNRVDKGRRGMMGMTADLEGDWYRGDFGTPEQEIPATGFAPGVYWESCMTMNDTWGFKSDDTNWKSDTTLIRNLIDTAGKGGNYLLNVGPDASGTIPQASAERMRAIGHWLGVNGESIYGTHAGVFARLPWGRSTTRTLPDGNTAIYLHVFDWPEDGRLLVPGLESPVLSARGLHRDRMLRVAGAEPTDAGVVVRLNGAAWDPHASVIELVVEGVPVINAEKADRAARVAPNSDGAFRLSPTQAEIHGHGPRIEHQHGDPNIGYWVNADATVLHRLRADRAATYRINLRYALAPDSAGSAADLVFTWKGAEKRVRFTPEVTGAWSSFRTAELGPVDLPAGPVDLRVVPVAKPGLAVINLGPVTLTPSGS